MGLADVPPLAPPTDRAWTLDDFKLGPILGTGSFGRVSLAKHKVTSAVCAIKALSKAHVVKNQQVRGGHVLCSPHETYGRPISDLPSNAAGKIIWSSITADRYVNAVSFRSGM